MRADYIAREELGHILAALMPPNRLALEVSLATGLRIGDVLNMRTEQVANASERRITIKELKTGKTRRLKLPVELYRRMIAQAGRVWIWEGRNDWRKHRTRQAVYKDLARAARLWRLPAKLHISPHTARKVYAVTQYQRTGDLSKIQGLLNHSSEAVTVLYAMADVLTQRKLGKGGQGGDQTL